MPIRSQTAATSSYSREERQTPFGSVSSQFFMKRPITSQPCSFKRYAATEESTPPDMPTAISFLFIFEALDPLFQWRVSGKEIKKSLFRVSRNFKGVKRRVFCARIADLMQDAKR